MKKVVTLMFSLAFVVAMSSCSDEDKIKSKCEDIVELEEIEYKEVHLEILETQIELMEELLDIKDDKEFEEAFEKALALGCF